MPMRVKLGPNCSLFPEGDLCQQLQIVQKVPLIGRLDERVPITPFHGCLVTSLQEAQWFPKPKVTGQRSRGYYPTLKTSRRNPVVVCAIFTVTVLGAVLPPGLFSATFGDGLEATGHLATVGVMPPSRRRPRDRKVPTLLTTKGSRSLSLYLPSTAVCFRSVLGWLPKHIR